MAIRKEKIFEDVLAYDSDTELYSVVANELDNYILIANCTDGTSVTWAPDQMTNTVHSKSDLIELRDLLNFIIEDEVEFI